MASSRVFLNFATGRFEGKCGHCGRRGISSKFLHKETHSILCEHCQAINKANKAEKKAAAEREAERNALLAAERARRAADDDERKEREHDDENKRQLEEAIEYRKSHKVCNVSLKAKSDCKHCFCGGTQRNRVKLEQALKDAILYNSFRDVAFLTLAIEDWDKAMLASRANRAAAATARMLTT
jgi:hypothetical protein